MNGVTSGINLQHSPTTRKFWEDYLALLEELAMRWPNGYSSIVDSTGKLINQQPANDQIINAEVQLQLGEEMVYCKLIQRTIGPDGQVTVTYDNNPFLNSIIYDVEFPDGQVKEYAANIIAENMLTQVDSDGMSTTLMEAIVDHQRDDENGTSTA